MLFVRFLAKALLLLLSLPLLAGEAEDRERIAQQIPQVTADQVRNTPIPGVYEVVVGPVVLYVSADGRYVIRGSLFDIKEDVNITETRQREARKDVLATLTEDELISFGPEDADEVVTVFTDTSCTYTTSLAFESGMPCILAKGLRQKSGKRCRRWPVRLTRKWR